MKRITATEFKAKCLRLLDEVAATIETITVIKRGRAVTQVIPAMASGGVPQDELHDTVWIVGNVLEPPLPAEVWEAELEAP